MSQNQAWINQYAQERGTRESVSGNGSSLVNTTELRQALPQIIKKYGIKSIVDMPCGDWNWMKEVDLNAVTYTGLDVVPGMIKDNNNEYGDTNITFRVHDAVVDGLPKADLLICRDLLFHLPESQVLQIIENVTESGCQFVLATTFPKIKNEDIIDDACIRWRKVNLCSPPYLFSEPEYIIQENDSEACQSRIMGLFRLEQ